MSTAPHIAVFPGSFDPLTSGHVDIIERGRFIFDKVIVSVLINRDKTPLFTTDERVAMIREVFADEKRLEVTSFSGLLVEFARRIGAQFVIRGLRAVSDFDYELQMAQVNQELWSDIETLFLTPDVRYSFLSASIVREVASLGGDVSNFVAPQVATRLRQRFEG